MGKPCRARKSISNMEFIGRLFLLIQKVRQSQQLRTMTVWFDRNQKRECSILCRSKQIDVANAERVTVLVGRWE